MLFRILLLAAGYVVFTDGLKCWSCKNAESTTDCKMKGRLQECMINEGMCLTSLRNVNGKWMVTKQCKQKQACHNNAIQNARVALIHYKQCNLKRQGAVCRCCCKNSACNRNQNHCIPRRPMCPAFPKPVNGDAVCEYEKNPREIGSVCKFSCDEGYFLEGSPSTLCTMKGNPVTGEIRFGWDRPVPRCVQITCLPQLSAPDFGLMSCTSHVPTPGTFCSFKCDAGHVMIGSPHSMCSLPQHPSSTGVWNHPEPTCLGKCKCQDEPVNGNVFCSSSFLSVGTDCLFACYEGFYRNGTEENRCIETVDGPQWNLSPPTCEPIRCQALVAPEHGTMSCTSDGVAPEFGTVCTFVCNSGYKLAGSPYAICNVSSSSPSLLPIPTTTDESGRWSHEVPECECEQCKLEEIVTSRGGSSSAKTCDVEVVEVENGVVSCVGGGRTSKTCHFTCDEKFTLIGRSQNITCRRNGKWSDEIPSCARTCHDQVAPHNGQITCDSDSMTVGSTCSFSCYYGYSHNGTEQNTCIETVNGPEWSLSPPTCEQTGKPCSNDVHNEIENGFVECTDGNAHGSVCLYFCHHPFILQGPAYSECVDGVWSTDQLPQCTAEA